MGSLEKQEGAHLRCGRWIFRKFPFTSTEVGGVMVCEFHAIDCVFSREDSACLSTRLDAPAIVRSGVNRADANIPIMNNDFHIARHY